jgi:DNA-binding MarR family transcriptional regulator
MTTFANQIYYSEMDKTTNQVLKEPVGRIMAKIGKLFQEELHGDLKNLDINRSFYPLILIESEEGITQQELAGKLLCDKVQVVRIIDYLSSKGYVERKPSQTDKRKYKLMLTEKAKLNLPNIKKAINHSISVAFDCLSENQISELHTMLSTIESNLVSHKSQVIK